MKTVKSLHHLLPTWFHSRANDFRFKLLRLAGSLSLLRKIGVLTCRNNVQVSVANAENVAKKYNIKAYQIIERNHSATKPAIHLPSQKLNELQPIWARDETMVLEIVNCDNRPGFSFRNNHLLDAEMNVFYEKVVDFKSLPIYREIISKKVDKFSGTIAYLSNTEISNYGHWMCFTLPMIRKYKQLFDLNQIDYFYVGSSFLTNWHKESLAKLGIGMNQVIQEACTANRLITAISNRVATINEVEYLDPAPVIQEDYDFIRDLFYEKRQPSPKKKKRIYVKRGDVKRRKVINEFSILDLLDKYGFEAVGMNDKTLQEEVDIFYQAEAIVAPHGSALVNLLFIQPGTKVIELIPYGYVNNFFYALASYGDAEYFYLQGENLSQTNVAPQYLDIYVDIEKLEAVCQQALG